MVSLKGILIRMLKNIRSIWLNERSYEVTETFGTLEFC